MAKRNGQNQKPIPRSEPQRESWGQKKPAAGGEEKAGRTRPNPTQQETRSKPKG
jgi:hypothetical protein